MSATERQKEKRVRECVCGYRHACMLTRKADVKV